MYAGSAPNLDGKTADLYPSLMLFPRDTTNTKTLFRAAHFCRFILYSITCITSLSPTRRDGPLARLSCPPHWLDPAIGQVADLLPPPHALLLIITFRQCATRHGLQR